MIRTHGRAATICGAALLATILLPLLVPAAWLSVLAKMLIAALFALAFNLLVGQAGMLSFGHAAYFAIGAFATLHVMQAAEHGGRLPTPLLPLAGAIAGCVVGGVAGLFATLRSGVYFSMITLAIAELFYTLAPNLAGLFGGEGGISSMRMPWMRFSFGSDLEVYYLVLLWTVAATLGLRFYTSTPFGRLTLALRENEQRVRFLGYDTYRTKVVVFAISAMISGLAGGLLSVANESANYVLFDTNVSANVVLNTFIGGSGVFFGPALGAVLMTAFGYAVSDLTQMLPLYQGVLFVAVMLWAPRGIAGILVAQAAPLREGWWQRLVLPYLFASLPALAILAGAIFVIEACQRLFALDYIERAQRAGALLPFDFIGQQWQPLSPTTWVLPLACLAAGGALLPVVIRTVRAVWNEHAR